MRYDRKDIALAAASIVILGCAAYEAGIALKWISIGQVPGEEARYQGAVMLAGGVSVLTGICLSLVPPGSRVVAALAPASAAFMIGRYYAFDSYYAPTLRRASEGGVFSPTWIYVAAVLVLAAGLVVLIRPRLQFLSAPTMFLCLFTAYFVNIGH